MSERETIPGTFPEPPSTASQYELAAWRRKVGRDYANPALSLRVLRHRYGRDEAALARIAGEFEIPERTGKRKGR